MATDEPPSLLTETGKCFFFQSLPSKHTYPAFLHALGEHDDVASVLLPHHAPEIIASRWQGTLCSYVFSLGQVTLSNQIQRIKQTS
jgi:hypothetical protein